MFKVHLSLIHNRGCETVIGLSNSPKKAHQKAIRQAWAQYEKSGATNWADVWLTVTNPYGKVVFHNWCPSDALFA
jgi:hypothetical protein